MPPIVARLVLTCRAANTLPPPLDSITPVVTLMNHPTYTTYRQRVSSLSLFENVYVKLLPPAWVSTELGEKPAQELKNILKLFSESNDQRSDGSLTID